MTENEKLRALLAEARLWIKPDSDVRNRIDAALAEPVSGCVECAQERAEYDSLAAQNRLLHRERDEARAEVEKWKSRYEALRTIASAEAAASHAEGAQAYRRGAEAMREKAEAEAWREYSDGKFACEGLRTLARSLRALPLPKGDSDAK